MKKQNIFSSLKGATQATSFQRRRLPFSCTHTNDQWSNEIFRYHCLFGRQDVNITHTQSAAIPSIQERVNLKMAEHNSFIQIMINTKHIKWFDASRNLLIWWTWPQARDVIKKWSTLGQNQSLMRCLHPLTLHPLRVKKTSECHLAVVFFLVFLTAFDRSQSVITTFECCVIDVIRPLWVWKNDLFSTPQDINSKIIRHTELCSWNESDAN